MKPLLLLLAALTTFGCTAVRDLRNNHDTYQQPPFYAKYLNTGSELDAQIQSTLEAVRQNPRSAHLHNELGSLLVQKGFPKDAEREFERAVDADGNFYPAWYNLGLVRAARGDDLGARRAFYRTIARKPGHSAALFQLGLVEEKRQHTDRAVALYAKAYRINPGLLSVRRNPRILDSKLTHLALLKLYPVAYGRDSMQFQGAPAGYRVPEPQAPAAETRPETIATPTPPATDPQQPAKPPGE
jgi:tetratricopeptide (TPR) repeat protein